MSDRYFIKPGYVARAAPDYFVDIEAATGLVCQPDVYIDATFVANTLGAVRLIDIGCGNGYKLAELHPTFEVIGIDFGQNLDTCQARYPFGTWLLHDLDADDPLPLTDRMLEQSVVIASDVIEHLVRPELMLRKLRHALELTEAVLLSTPERDLTWGAEHMGPPPNPHHVREWNIHELGALLESEGFMFGDVGLTRNNNMHNVHNNIFAMLVRDEQRLDRLGHATELRKQQVPAQVRRRATG